MDFENKLAVLDVDKIIELGESLGTDSRAGLFERFVLEGDCLLEHLFEFKIKQNRLADVIAEVHKVAGSAAVLGTIEMHAQLRRMEVLGKSDKSENMWNAVDHLEAVWTRTKLSLNGCGFVNS
jgi:HPt (histidine-containing phosphotransfer) domain-containing protein